MPTWLVIVIGVFVVLVVVLFVLGTFGARRHRGQLDERFHETIVKAAQNREMSHVHHDITERIRIVRRLDFTEPERVRHTYEEHAAIVRALLARSYREAKLLLTAHIASSKAEVRRITLHRLHEARAAKRGRL